MIVLQFSLLFILVVGLVAVDGLAGNISADVVSADVVSANEQPSQSEASGQPVASEAADQLSDARELYQRSTLEKLLVTTDPLELGEAPVWPKLLKQLVEDREFSYLFDIGDEAFETELDTRFGTGVGPGGQTGLRLLHGQLGGFDGGSCRSCHFKGGPDGSGSFSSLAAMRSDGQSLRSAIHRDAPHVMGVGYISRIAEEMTAELQETAELARSLAVQSGESVSRPLAAQGMPFGEVVGLPGGSLDVDKVRHVAPDLIIRPFGHKGRARTLVEFTDEAMQMHHGLQSDSRVRQFAGQDAVIGRGPAYDPDDDGVSYEATSAHSVLLAIYLSMLPVPEIRPPKEPTLVLAWSRGRRLFEDVGCADCHRPSLRFEDDRITHVAASDSSVRATVPLLEFGQEPVPRKLDYGAGLDDRILPGTPVYAYTDLRLHDLGPALSDPRPEVRADGSGETAAELWLTRSLWGIADTAPYLHDGRALTLSDAIDWHGGEAAAARERFFGLTEPDQRNVLLFLQSLTRGPTVLVE